MRMFFISIFKVCYNMICSYNRIRRQTRVLPFFILFAAFVFAGVSPAGASKGTLPPEAQKVVSGLLAMQDAAAPLPEKADLDAFLSYTTSPLNLTPVGGEAPYPAKYEKGAGILWRAKVNAPLAVALEYLYNPKTPSAIVYPASIRHVAWRPGSDILNLAEPLWRQLGKHADAPLVLRGEELEEITPDTFSGAYYKYALDRLIILTEHEGRQTLISVTWQKGKSDVGKKAAVIGDYENWDYVYSGAHGTLAKGVGWADTYIYSSASIIVLYEDAPGGSTTGYAMYRWMDAGWSGMNMVKAHHIQTGAERSFAGLKAFLESPKRPAAEAVAAYVDSLEALALPVLQERFHPYSVKVEEAAATVDALKTEDFQKVIKDAGYGNSLTKEEIIAALTINHVKLLLGKPLLAGALDGEGSAAASPGSAP